MPACADYVLLRRDWSAGGQRDISLVDNHLRPALRLVRGPTSRKRAYHPLPFTALLRPRVQANRSTSRSPSLQQRISSFHLSLSLSRLLLALVSLADVNISRLSKELSSRSLSFIDRNSLVDERSDDRLVTHVLVCNVLCWVVSLVVEIHTHTHTHGDCLVQLGDLIGADRAARFAGVGLRFAEDAVSINCSCFRKLEF